ncbi:extracellular catalytic domain type 1 short-chain-length polyhydroxyalkanoate depolymerase [Paracoccus salsus]|uniref:extracellular catalytic domain type 1 short-chain-length polyhydroxyalkanoate depolymerase n=1 Tax=Paracoccus salsus TaxID=2911061 RepID=UPI001F1674CA|nr:PHB depolymerase family esterase [Paracoccus salsus]MCF3974414.1 PHB depolymerase family esterase [Paracoccus salsus]
MKSFNADALRRAIGPARLAAANDLVRETLTRHGLMTAGATPAAMPAGLPAGLHLPGLAGAGPGAAPPAPLPDGASFEAARFAGEAGGRDYLTYVPASASDGVQGLVLMLHGCTQTHADFATGTGMNALAETHRLVIVYPQQSRGENAQSCWNWFSPGDQRRGRGEPAILAGLARQVAQAHGVPPQRTFVAGLSAGAAMAVILGRTHGDVFAAVGAHSGLPHGAARDVASAFAAMSATGTGTEHRAPRPDGHAARMILFHGDADHTVHPANSDRIAADLLNHAPAQTLIAREDGKRNGRGFTRETTTTTDGAPLLERWTVKGLGHAWSGGRPGGSYADPAGPDASAEMVRFFLEHPAREG